MRFLHIYTVFFGWRVRQGPFRGMRYVRDSVCSTLAPKLLGTYELELEDWIEPLFAHPPATIINIGAAEGYYAVGFALLCPHTRVVAFEAEAQGRDLMARLAGQNRLAGRVQIEGACTAETLRPFLDAEKAPLLFVDIEGGETALLDPARLPALRRCPMIIELHESHAPAADILRTRFVPTHSIQERWTKPRTLEDLPPVLRLLARLSRSPRFLDATTEQRPGPMRWFYCQPATIAA